MRVTRFSHGHQKETKTTKTTSKPILHLKANDEILYQLILCAVLCLGVHKEKWKNKNLHI